MFKVLAALTFGISILVPQDLHAATAAKLTGVTAKRTGAGVSIDLSFDRPFAAKSLKPAFERNFVQLVMKPAKLDAAKIQNVADSEVQKVFAYPYNFDTARLRLILKKDNAWAKGRITMWNNNPKSVRIFVKDPVKTAEAPEAAPKPVAKQDTKPAAKPSITPAIAAAPAPTTPSAAPEGDTQEKTLLKEVVANTRDIDINNPDSVKAALAAPLAPPQAQSQAVSAISKPESGPVGISADPTRHFARMAIALFGVLGLFLGGVFVVKKYASKIKKLPFGKKERLIQVVATHYLGNKKSISLVKITGEYMVVGVSNDGISLISKLGPEVNVDKYLEDRFWGGTFEKHLDTYAKDTKITKAIDLSDEKYAYDGAKDIDTPKIAEKVTDKVELSPVRASIKEKLTKLKPLA